MMTLTQRETLRLRQLLGIEFRSEVEIPEDLLNMIEVTLRAMGRDFSELDRPDTIRQVWLMWSWGNYDFAGGNPAARICGDLQMKRDEDFEVYPEDEFSDDDPWLHVELGTPVLVAREPDHEWLFKEVKSDGRISVTYGNTKRNRIFDRDICTVGELAEA